MKTSELPGELTSTVELSGENVGAGLVDDARLGVLIVGVKPPGDDADAALKDGDEGSPEANPRDGAKPAPQPANGCEPVSTR